MCSSMSEKGVEAAPDTGRAICDEAVTDERGGNPACLAHEVCPECGAVVAADGHRPGCPAASP